jgi:hypothetical protein
MLARLHAALTRTGRTAPAPSPRHAGHGPVAPCACGGLPVFWGPGERAEVPASGGSPCAGAHPGPRQTARAWYADMVAIAAAGGGVAWSVGSFASTHPSHPFRLAQVPTPRAPRSFSLLLHHPTRSRRVAGSGTAGESSSSAEGLGRRAPAPLGPAPGAGSGAWRTLRMQTALPARRPQGSTATAIMADAEKKRTFRKFTFVSAAATHSGRRGRWGRIPVHGPPADCCADRLLCPSRCAEGCGPRPAAGERARSAGCSAFPGGVFVSWGRTACMPGPRLHGTRMAAQQQLQAASERRDGSSIARSLTRAACPWAMHDGAPPTCCRCWRRMPSGRSSWGMRPGVRHQAITAASAGSKQSYTPAHWRQGGAHRGPRMRTAAAGRLTPRVVPTGAPAPTPSPPSPLPRRT